MNHNFILKLADSIESKSIPHLHFEMDTWYEEGDYYIQVDIAGWACKLAEPQADLDEHFPFEVTARDLLGLTEMEADELFIPQNFKRYNTQITRAEAVATLRRLAETGKVVWGDNEGDDSEEHY